MAKIEKSIDINVPVRTAYNQWTQFEEFPRFMEGIKEVQQMDNKRLHWRAEIAGKDKEWDAEISEQTPDRRIAWHSTTGVRNAGQVSFQPIDDNRTRVTLLMDYEPEGVVEKAGDAMGVVSGRVQGDLERFKEFIESRGAESGAWRGEIRGGQQTTRGGTGTPGSTGGPSTGGPSTGGSNAPRGGSPGTGGTSTGRGSTGTTGGPTGSKGSSTDNPTGRSSSQRVDPEDMDDEVTR
ncbi:SRPBCC family protein [bacterium]|nr:MAG: SRPBCC family protein [bacterium]